MKLNSLNDLFEDKLNDLYGAEMKTADLLPKIAEACSSNEIKDALKEHILQSRNQVSRLEQAFSNLNIKPKIKENPVIDALIDKCNEMLNSSGNPDVLNAGLIAVEQGIEHYEISAYGTARAWASTLGFTDIADQLQATLNEEKYTDEKLSKIAEKGYGGEAVNKKAA